MRGSRLIALIALIASLIAIGMVLAMRHQRRVLRERHQLIG